MLFTVSMFAISDRIAEVECWTGVLLLYFVTLSIDQFEYTPPPNLVFHIDKKSAINVEH